MKKERGKRAPVAGYPRVSGENYELRIKNYEFGPLICTERDEKGKMKKEKGKRAPVPRYVPMNRDYSATGFSPQGRKPPHAKSPPLRGATGVNTATNYHATLNNTQGKPWAQIHHSTI